MFEKWTSEQLEQTLIEAERQAHRPHCCKLLALTASLS